MVRDNLIGAAAIVGTALPIFGGLLALTGKNQVKRATPPMPERALESVMADIDAVRERVRR